MENATDVTSVTDEDLDKNISELSRNTERTEEQNAELDSAKKEKGSRSEKRIAQEVSKTKAAQYEATRVKQENEDYKKRIEDLESKANAQPVKVIEETVDIAGKRYYTDDTLISMRDAGQMSDTEAWKHQRQRDKAEVKEELRDEVKTTNAQTEEKRVRTEDNQKVLTEYPQFNRDHPNFNPEDPLYKEASRIYANGYNTNPKGMSLAVQDAKRNLRMGENIDASDDLGMRSSTAPNRTTVQEKKAEFIMTEDDKDRSWQMYRDKTNPNTGNAYTASEAEGKYKQAMQRAAQRRER